MGGYDKTVVADAMAVWRRLLDDQDHWQSIEDCTRQAILYAVQTVSKDMY